MELFAITEHPAPSLPDFGGLSEVASGGLAAVCGPAGDGDPSPQDLWRFEGVVEALMKDRDLLPARYGTRLADEGVALRALAERYDELVGALERVRGAVELSVRVLAQAGDLRARARAEGGARRVHQELFSLARESSERLASGELLRAAYLVDRVAVDGFVETVGGLQRAHPELRLLCTGPWPPYSFAER
jgi:Gas vesicle synthesis protein GvpL/GvpF